MLRLLISTGEVSGDLQGSLLVEALYREAERRSLPLEIIALGGSRMKDAGAELIFNTSSMGAIGFWEALPFILPTFRAQAKVDRFLRENSFDAVILIDYMGPNIRLGNKLRDRYPDLPIIYYIAPQEWAWRLGDGGTTDLIGFTNKILAIFQAEAEFYSARGGSVSWVGHPMLDTLKPLPSRSEALNKLGLSSNKRLLLLLPASRSQELRYLMPTLAKAAALIQQRNPDFYIIVPAGLKEFEKTLKKCLELEGVVGRVIESKQVDDLKPYLFAAAELALGKSGTINMELALNDVPQIVGYKVGRITAFLATKVLRFKVDHISPVNLLLDERLVPELLQDEFTPEAILQSAITIIEDTNERDEILKGYERLRELLGQPGVTTRAANQVLDLIEP